MGLPQIAPRFTFDDYLAWEAEQTERHEYYNGEVFCMAGAKDSHNTIALNIAGALRAALRGTPCRAFISDMKLQVEAADAAFYPDVLVTCDPRDKTPESATAKQHPSLIVEVLSESTAAFDRGLKFEAYRMLDSLQEYLLVEQDRRHVDLYRRGENDRWVLEPMALDGRVELHSLGLALGLDEIYEDVDIASSSSVRIAS